MTNPHFLRDSQGRNAAPLRLTPTYRGEPSMAGGDETSLSVWDLSTQEGRDAAQLFYDLQKALPTSTSTSTGDPKS